MEVILRFITHWIRPFVATIKIVIETIRKIIHLYQ